MDVKNYVKKPVKVTAIQWTGKNQNEIERFVDNGSLHWEYMNSAGGGASPAASLHIKTLEGMMHASPEDYIIRGINGEYYPCKPDIFYASYDVAEKE